MLYLLSYTGRMREGSPDFISTPVSLPPIHPDLSISPNPGFAPESESLALSPNLLGLPA